MNGLNGAEWSEWCEWSSISPLRLDQEASDLNITEQVHCTPEKIPCTPVQPDDRDLTHVLCESETSQLNQITPGSELKEEVI